MKSNSNKEIAIDDNENSVAPTISEYVLNQLMAALGNGGTNEEKNARMQHVMDTIQSLQPRDKFEEMLAGQIIVANETSIDCMKRAQAKDIDDRVRQSELRMANKFSKLLTDQLKTLYVYRSKELAWQINYKSKQRSDELDENFSDLF